MATRNSGPRSSERGVGRHRAAGAIMVRRSWACAFDDGSRRARWSDGLTRRVLQRWEPWSSVVCARTDERVLAVTFDDGPDPARTPAVLDVLAEHGARATFFMLSDAATAHPALVRDVVAGGHAVALHGVDHRRITGLSTAATREMLQRGRAALEDLSGRAVQHYRPAYGALTRQQAEIAHGLDLDTVLWSGWARDWDEEDPGRVAARARRACHPGGILLLHDTLADQDLTAGRRFDSSHAADELLGRLGAEGWRTLTTEELLAERPQYRCAWWEKPAGGGSA